VETSEEIKEWFDNDENMENLSLIQGITYHYQREAV
jgi:hypothetical protein